MPCPGRCPRSVRFLHRCRGTTRRRARSRDPTRTSARAGSGSGRGMRRRTRVAIRPNARATALMFRRRTRCCRRPRASTIDGSGAAPRATISSLSGSSTRSSRDRAACPAGSCGEHATEVLGDEVTAGHEDEAVVRAQPGQRTGGDDRQVGREPVRVIAEHHVQRSVGVRGQASRPGRTAREINRTRGALERDRVDAFDRRDRVGSECVAQQERLARVAEHDHRWPRPRRATRPPRAPVRARDPRR